jgi:hypothetical protein
MNQWLSLSQSAFSVCRRTGSRGNPPGDRIWRMGCLVYQGPPTFVSQEKYTEKNQSKERISRVYLFDGV